MTEYEEAAAYLLERTEMRPKIGIICGSGLSGLSNSMTESETFKYSSIPGFPKVTVPGHAEELIFGNMGTYMEMTI
jgi:purine-nucleoside phosphorylase